MLAGYWSARKIFVGAKLAQIWDLTLSAAMWTIWLARNELVFEQTMVKIKNMIMLLKLRSFKWSLAWGGLSGDLQNLWLVNPMGAFLLHCRKCNEKGPIWWNSEYIGFADGSWERSGDGHIKSGVGGVLIDNIKNIIFNFSGCSKALNPLLAEKEAILQLHSHFRSSHLKNCSLQIYSDSMTLVDIALKNRGGLFNINPVVEDSAWFAFVKDHNTRISYVGRDFLKGADMLAKQGKNSGKSFLIWC